MPAELYYNPYRTACGGVEEATDQRSESVHWIDATVHLEAAARLRIVRLPALVIDGRLVVQGPRAFAQLRAWIARQGNDR